MAERPIANSKRTCDLAGGIVAGLSIAAVSF